MARLLSGSLACPAHRRPSHVGISEMSQKILVVRSGALGDTILTFPLLESLKTSHPGATITLFGSRKLADLLPRELEFQPLDSTQNSWLFGDESSKVPDWVFQHDKAYVILNKPDLVVSNLRKIGIPSVHWIASQPPEGKHLVEHLHEGLGLRAPPRRPALMHLAPPDTKNLIWLHPGSGGMKKCAPLQLMSSFVESLRETARWNLAVTAGEEDAFLEADPLWRRLTDTQGTLVLKNRPLREICAQLGGARAYLGNDSGITHLAAGLGIPATVFFVSTDPRQWAPWVPPEQLTIMDLRSG
jgi:heptosyltransferase III